MIVTPCTGFHVATSYKDGNPKNLLSSLYNLSYLLPIYYILSDYIYIYYDYDGAKTSSLVFAQKLDFEPHLSPTWQGDTLGRKHWNMGSYC